jgi:hypothetical protein
MRVDEFRVVVKTGFSIPDPLMAVACTRFLHLHSWSKLWTIDAFTPVT